MHVYRIAISGKMRSGKDTLAKELILCRGFMRMSFADKLKDVAEDLFGPLGDNKDRDLLIELSRHLCSIDPAVWIKYVINRLPMRRSVVITDLRFPNEYHTLRGLGFLMVRIEIGRIEQLSRATKTEPDLTEEAFNELRFDPTETLLDKGYSWDLVLNGTDCASELLSGVDLMLEDAEVRRANA